MSNINHYWENKVQRKEKALKHTVEMEKAYSTSIEAAKSATKIYGTDFRSDKLFECETEIVISDSDSVTAIFNNVSENGKVAVLNFSSYRYPGGMFINGSKAQEECLCHESFLYNVLKDFVVPFYDWNEQHKNKSLYLNRALYTPNVVFLRDSHEVLCDVITCAAPNKASAQKYANVTHEENTKVLRDRVRYVLDVAKHNDVDTLILGAYGCGVFGQNPTEVASIFKEYLTTTHKCFKKVVFAIPEGKDLNLNAFRNVWCE